MPSNLVLISGKQGSGKSSLQKELVRTAIEVIRTSAFGINFADVLYQMHHSVLATLGELYPEYLVSKDGDLLQTLGDWGRKKRSNLWVDITRKRIDQHWANFIVIGDCRFPNEFDEFPEALRVRLVCSEEVRKKRCHSWRENTQHASEIALDEYEKSDKFDLYFDTEIYDVNHCVEMIVAQLKKRSWLEKRK